MLKDHEPQNVGEVIWPDQLAGDAVIKQIEAGELRDNLLLYGPPGTGKTTTAEIIKTQLAVDPLNTHHYNGGRHNSTDDLDQIINTLENNWVFASSGYQGRLVIYDEIDELSDKAIKRLKSVLDQFESSTRWVFTTNNYEKLENKDPAFVDRCRSIRMDFWLSEPARDRFVSHLVDQLGVPSTTAKAVALKCNYNWRQLHKSGVIK